MSRRGGSRAGEADTRGRGPRSGEADRRGAGPRADEAGRGRGRPQAGEADRSDGGLPAVEAARGRRGRPRAGEAESKRRLVLDVAYQALAEHGYDRTTMLEVARRSGASKETLYAWFGSKAGLFGAVVRDQAARTNQTVRGSLDTAADPRAALAAIMTSLLTLLSGERSVTINRAAMTSPELAAVLVAQGRFTTGPLVAGYLGDLMVRGLLREDDPETAFRTLYGLVVQDTQIRALLGNPPSDRRAVVAQAERGVDNFLRLYAPPTLRA